MFLFVLSLISASAEFPICTASGDQLYPDVCWDGSAFWVVWDDERDGIADIYATRIGENGNCEVPFLVRTSGKEMLYPRIAYSPDSLLLTFWEDYPDSAWEYILCYIFLDESGSYYPGSGGIVGIFAAGPIIPIRCEEHFALLYTYGYPAEFEYPTWGEVALLDGNTPVKILEVPQDAGQFVYVDNGVWNGERLFCVTSYGCIWLEDTLEQDPFQDGYFFPRDPLSVTNDTFEFYRGIALAVADERIGMLNSCSWSSRPWFDLVDGEGNLVNPDLLYLGLGDVDASCQGSAMAYGNGRFVAVSDLRVGDYPHRKRTLWGAEIHQSVNLLGEGFIMAGPAQEKEPAIAFGENHFLLVWTDNRNGDWDIYGRILDSLEYSGVSEPGLIEDEYPRVNVDQTVFTDVLKINLSAAAAGGTVIIHDALGRVVKRIELEGRSYSCVWDGRDSRGNDAGEGVYFVSLAGKTRSVRLKVIKIK